LIAATMFLALSAPAQEKKPDVVFMRVSSRQTMP
jgi:hypothetical protein